MTTFTNQTKNSETLTLQSKTANPLTWNQATFDWNDAQGTWNQPTINATLQTKTSETMTLQTKN